MCSHLYCDIVIFASYLGIGIRWTDPPQHRLQHFCPGIFSILVEIEICKRHFCYCVNSHFRLLFQTCPTLFEEHLCYFHEIELYKPRILMMGTILLDTFHTLEKEMTINFAPKIRMDYHHDHDHHCHHDHNHDNHHHYQILPATASAPALQLLPGRRESPSR